MKTKFFLSLIIALSVVAVLSLNKHVTECNYILSVPGSNKSDIFSVAENFGLLSGMNNNSSFKDVKNYRYLMDNEYILSSYFGKGYDRENYTERYIDSIGNYRYKKYKRKFRVDEESKASNLLVATITLNMGDSLFNFEDYIDWFNIEFNHLNKYVQKSELERNINRTDSIFREINSLALAISKEKDKIRTSVLYSDNWKIEQLEARRLALIEILKASAVVEFKSSNEYNDAGKIEIINKFSKTKWKYSLILIVLSTIALLVVVWFYTHLKEFLKKILAHVNSMF